MTTTPYPVPLTDPAWLLLHAYFRDAMTAQGPKLRSAVLEEVGATLGGFLVAVAEGLLVVASELVDDGTAHSGLNYVVGLRVSDGIAMVTRVHAQRLGLDAPDLEAAELRVIARRRPGMIPAGPGDPARPETWRDADG